MTFLDAVNRLLRASGIMRGDDDELDNFSSTQHNAAMNLAIVAVQSELADLVADRLIPYEKTEASITTTSGTRTYTLESDFVRFFGQRPFLYNAADNIQMFEYPGGVDALRHAILDYKTQSGQPYYWYYEDTTTKKIGLFPVPDAAETWTYDYEKDLRVSASTDTLPFHSTTEGEAFADFVLPRFKRLLTRAPLDGLRNDSDRMEARARLANLLRHTEPSKRYGARYV